MHKLSYTLLELLVVLLLISLTASLIIPKITSFLPQTKQKDFVTEVVNLLKLAREEALLKSKEIFFIIKPNKREILLTDQDFNTINKIHIPETIEIKAENLIDFSWGYGVEFFSNGYSSGGIIEIINYENNKQFIINIARYNYYILLSSPSLPPFQGEGVNPPQGGGSP